MRHLAYAAMLALVSQQREAGNTFTLQLQQIRQLSASHESSNCGQHKLRAVAYLKAQRETFAA